LSVVGNAPRALAGPPNRSGSRNGKRRPGIAIPLGRLLWNGPPGTGRKLTKIKKIKKVKVDADTQNRTPANENKRGTHLPLQ